MQLNIPLSESGLRALLRALIGAGVGMTLLHLAIHATAEGLPWGPLAALFDLDEEASVPTWFSSTQLFAISAVLALAARANARQSIVPTWLLSSGAAVFLLLSMDEGAMLHERLAAVAGQLELDWLPFADARSAWLLPYALLGLIMVAVAFPPLVPIWPEFPAELQLGTVGAAMLAMGAAGLELITYYTLPESAGFWYELAVAVEEMLEMTGASVILYAALRFAAAIAEPAPEPSRASRSRWPDRHGSASGIRPADSLRASTRTARR